MKPRASESSDLLTPLERSITISVFLVGLFLCMMLFCAVNLKCKDLY